MATAKKQQQEEENKKFVFTSKNINEITEQLSDGIILKRYQNPWLKNEVGIRRAGISFGISPEEVQEYIRCMDDVQYFAERYCQIKREDGSIGPIKLRDYQRGILDLYKNNRVILCASRQSGKCATGQSGIVIENSNIKTLSELYYTLLSSYRKLTFLEKIKIKLYKLLTHLDNMHTKI